MICFVALPYQAYAISHSSLVVGLLSCAELMPVLLAGLIGGALADALERRKLILITQTCRRALHRRARRQRADRSGNSGCCSCSRRC